MHRGRFVAAYVLLTLTAMAALLSAVVAWGDGPQHCVVGLHDHLIPDDPHSPLLLARENWEAGIYPHGHLFVIVDCEPA